MLKGQSGSVGQGPDHDDEAPAASPSTPSLLTRLERTERHAERLARLSRFESQIHQAASKEALFTDTTLCMRELFKVQRASVTLVNKSQTSFDIYALNQDIGKSVMVGSMVPLKGTAVGEVVKQNSVSNAPDLAATPFTDRQALYAAGIRSCLQAPLNLNGHTIGSINLGADQPRAFDEDDEKILLQLSEAVARGLDHRRLIAEAQSASAENRETLALMERLRHLNEVAHQLNSSMSEDSACAVLARQLFNVIPFERGQLILVDRSGTLQVFALRANQLTAPPSKPSPSHMLDADFQSIIEAQLLDGDTELGVLRLHHEDLCSYTDQDRQLINQAASLFAATIRNIRLIENAKNAQSAAEASSAAKSTFVANISHEIRTPLNAIIGMTSLLASSGLDGEKQQFVETIRSSSETLLDVVNEVLDFSKIEANKVELENQPFEIDRCVEDVVDLFTTPTSQKDLQITHQLDPELPNVVTGDITRLRQVLVNLVGNATKFTEEGGIVIQTSLYEPSADPHTILVHFTVIDSGIGMTHSQLDALFEPFAQGDSSMTRRYGGTGLGLVIARRLVELMGGKIWAESELGRGSQFHFTVQLEVAKNPLEVIKERSSHDSDPSLSLSLRVAEKHPLVILVAEDNKVNQLVMLNILKRLGYRADVAADGLEVLTAIERQPYDVILMDMQMPHMDGLSATTRIRKRRGQTELPQIIAVTANATEADARRCLEAGMNDYLSKPIRIKDLVNALARAYRRLPAS